MPYRVIETDPGVWNVIDDSQEGDPDDDVLKAFTYHEESASMIAASLNMMKARDRNGTPFLLMSSVQAGIIGAMEKIADDLLSEDSFGLLNKQCTYCGITKPLGINPVHRPTCLISVIGEWKVLAAGMMDEMVRRSKAT